MLEKEKAALNNLAGVIGYFDEPQALVSAMKQVRNAKYKSYDAFSPYPIHGMDHAQGLERSPLPFVTFAAGLTGCTLGFLLQYLTSVVDWPLIVGGKPFNSWPAFVPVMFECTILFAGLATVGGMFILNGLPNLTKRAFDPRLTRDKFALLIEAPVVKKRFSLFDGAVKSDGESNGTDIDGEGECDDGQREQDKKKKAVIEEHKAFDEAEAAEFLTKLGATGVKSVYTEGWF